MSFKQMAIGCAILLAYTQNAWSQTGPQGPVSASPQQQRSSSISYVNARPRTLPIAPGYSDQQAQQAISGTPPSQVPAVPPDRLPVEKGALPASGPDKRQAVRTPVSKMPESLPDNPAQVDFGTSGLPFSTARADLGPAATNDQYPYSAAGKLFFNEGGQSYICSASLIKPGIVVTAAHCVSSFGKNVYYSDWEFHPGYRNGVSPFGKWTAAKAYVLTAYLNGTDHCQVAGVVCKDDIAILALASQNGEYPGKRTGWFSYGWDGAGFTVQKITHVTQIGYPGCLDNAGLMERNDSQGGVDASDANNTIIGSLMCGGSSGGPWILNFGLQPALTGTQFGSAPTPNMVVGVTSWGSTNNAVKWMGASPFRADNVKRLVDSACNDYPAACIID